MAQATEGSRPPVNRAKTSPSLDTIPETFRAVVAQHPDHVLPPESAGGRRRDVEVAGEHLDLVREPNVAKVASVLGAMLVLDPD